MKKILLSFLIISFTSCGSIMSVIENTNIHKKFESTSTYMKFINKKINVPNDKVIILNGETCTLFASEIVNKKLSAYYGVANKNYFASADQLDIKGCSGQIESLYKMVASNSDSITKAKKNDIAILEKLDLDPSKNTLLFIYSYKLGRYSKSKISSVIKDLSFRDDFDYRLLSLDADNIVNK